MLSTKSDKIHTFAYLPRNLKSPRFIDQLNTSREGPKQNIVDLSGLHRVNIKLTAMTSCAQNLFQSMLISIITYTGKMSRLFWEKKIGGVSEVGSIEVRTGGKLLVIRHLD